MLTASPSRHCIRFCSFFNAIFPVVSMSTCFLIMKNPPNSSFSATIDISIGEIHYMTIKHFVPYSVCNFSIFPRPPPNPMFAPLYRSQRCRKRSQTPLKLPTIIAKVFINHPHCSVLFPPTYLGFCFVTRQVQTIPNKLLK